MCTKFLYHKRTDEVKSMSTLQRLLQSTQAGTGSSHFN